MESQFVATSYLLDYVLTSNEAIYGYAAGDSHAVACIEVLQAMLVVSSIDGI